MPRDSRSAKAWKPCVLWKGGRHNQIGLCGSRIRFGSRKDLEFFILIWELIYFSSLIIKEVNYMYRINRAQDWIFFSSWVHGKVNWSDHTARAEASLATARKDSYQARIAWPERNNKWHDNYWHNQKDFGNEWRKVVNISKSQDFVAVKITL